MSEKIFLSWSGEKSLKIATVFYNWLHTCFNAETWTFKKDVKPGHKWETEISKTLKDCNKGIFFLTKENIDAPWINYEAGVISKGDPENSVSILKIDFNEIPRESPLSHYYNISFCKEDIFSLLNSILPSKNTEWLIKNFNTYWEELEKNYWDIIYSENPLIDENYSPVFKNVIPDAQVTILKKADKTLLNSFFRQEYEKIDPNSIGKRLQFMIDRAVIFVYLDDRECWGQYLYDLETANNSQHSSENYNSYQIAISVLKQVFSYHNMMSKDREHVLINSNPETIRNNLLNLLNTLQEHPELIKNKMLYCLLYDYLGLCYHKVALNKISLFLDVDKFDILNLNHRRLLESKKTSKDKSIDSIAKELTEAIKCFDYILELTEHKKTIGYRQMGEYVWDGFALYNKARNQFLLYVLGLCDDKWEKTMTQSVLSREESVKKHKHMPFAIFNNLYAEYLHARLEDISYSGKQPDKSFDTEYNQWIESCYDDVLQIKNKYKKIKLADKT